MAKSAPIEPEVPLFERLRRAAKAAAVAGDRATHATLHEIDLALSDVWHRMNRAAQSLQGEPLAIVRDLQRVL